MVINTLEAAALSSSFSHYSARYQKNYVYYRIIACFRMAAARKIAWRQKLCSIKVTLSTDFNWKLEMALACFCGRLKFHLMR